MRVLNGIVLAGLCVAFVGCASDDDGDGFAGKDCDDNNASINPEADEVCDGLDNNCDGMVDEDTAVDATEYYADTDSDGAKWSSASKEAF